MGFGRKIMLVPGRRASSFGRRLFSSASLAWSHLALVCEKARLGDFEPPLLQVWILKPFVEIELRDPFP